MPIVEVTYGPRISQDDLKRLAEALPHAVSVAVECPEEPYNGELEPGDVELRFKPLGPFDVSRLDLVVEVQSKWFESRSENRQNRCDQLRDQIAKSQVPPVSACICAYQLRPGPSAMLTCLRRRITTPAGPAERWCRSAMVDVNPVGGDTQRGEAIWRRRACASRPVSRL